MAPTKTPAIGTTLLRDKPVVQAETGRAEALVRAARAFLFETCQDVWETASLGKPLTLEQRAVMRLVSANVA